MTDRIHIVCLDAPSPPDYGGVFDLYYKIPALHALGWKVVLHYFQYKAGRGAAGLEPFCEAIYSYPRKSFLKCLFDSQPYIVASRVTHTLLNRMNADNAPVLLEGIHCTGIVPQLRKDKNVIIRIHNDEAVYYQQLHGTETSLLRKWYLKQEYRKLQAYQQTLPASAHYFFVSDTDRLAFAEKYKFGNSSFLPCFLPWQEVQSQEGMGNYCLYHGNLDVSENRKAAQWLIDSVFNRTSIPLVIAGRGAGQLKTNHTPAHVKFVEAPGDDELTGLIRHAHIHLLPSFNATGVKLKLLHALFEGRFCITNRQGLAGSGLREGAVTLAETADDLLEGITMLMQRPFTSADRQQRISDLESYDNSKNAKQLSDLM